MNNYFIDCCGGIGFEDKPEIDAEFGIFTNCPECGSRKVLSLKDDTLDDSYTENMMMVGC